MAPATYGAEMVPESKPTDSVTTSLSSESTPQTPQGLADSLSQVSQTLATESSALASESAAHLLTINDLSRRLKQSQTEADELRNSLDSTRNSFAAYTTNCEKEISYAEGIAANQTKRAERAEAERDFWRTGGITCASIGLLALVLSFIF